MADYFLFLLFSVSIKKQKMLAESKIIKTQKLMKGFLIAQNVSDPRLWYQHSKHSTPIDSCNTDFLNWIKQQKTKNQRIKENKKLQSFWSLIKIFNYLKYDASKTLSKAFSMFYPDLLL